MIATSWPEATADGFNREGVSSAGIEAAEFREWIGKISDADMHAVEAFLIGDCGERETLSRMIRERSNAPVLCLNERHSLDDTLGLFAAGVDDVVRKPVHVREILARVGAINRRVFGQKGHVTVGELRVYFDGREPEANGEPFPLPRRERRILEFLLRCRGRRVSKTQIFNAVYGLFDENVDENVIEKPHQQVEKEAEASSGVRSDRFEALSRLLHRKIVSPDFAAPACLKAPAPRCFSCRNSIGFPARLWGVLNRGREAARGEARLAERLRGRTASG